MSLEQVRGSAAVLLHYIARDIGVELEVEDEIEPSRRRMERSLLDVVPAAVDSQAHMERRPDHFVEVALSHLLWSRPAALGLSPSVVVVGVGVGSVLDPRWPGHASPTAFAGRNSGD